MSRLALSVYSAVFLAASWAQAQSTAPAEFSFCDVTIISKEQELAKSQLGDDSRFHEMERLYNEIGILRKSLRTPGGVPLGFIKNCLAKKNETFTMHGRSAGATAAGKFQYHFIIGKYLEQQGNTKEAFDHFAKASDIDSKDYTAPHKAYTLLVDLESQRLKMAEKNPGGITQHDVENSVKQMNIYLSRIVENPKAPVSLRVDVYLTRARSLELMGREAAAVADWKQALALDPKNTTALSRLAAFEMYRGRKAEARAYLETLAPMAKENPKLQKSLIEIQLDSEDYISALKTAETARSMMPKDVEIQSLQARALAGNDRLKEAEAIHGTLFKENGQNKVVRQTQAYIHLLRGEKWAKAKLPGQALAEFQQALALQPDDVKLRTRMAILIFEQRQAMGFKPDAPTRIDLDQTVTLLEPLLKNEFIEQRTLEVMVSAASKSSKPARGATGCERYSTEFGSYPTLALVLDCATNYKAAGKTNKARKAIEDALGDPRFRGMTGALASALSSIR